MICNDCPHEHGCQGFDCDLQRVEHAALSADLARALGYVPDSPGVRGSVYCKDSYGGGKHVRVWTARGKSKPRWRTFDYRDPTVIVPLIEWLLLYAAKKQSSVTFHAMFFLYEHDLALYVAQAVIAVKAAERK